MTNVTAARGEHVEARIHYTTTTDGVSIAYTSFGEGGVPLLCLRAPSMSHIQQEFQLPFETRDHEFEQMSRHRQVVRFDSRGSGLSDRDVEDISLEARVRDIEAVVGVLGLERFAIHAQLSTGTAAIAYAVAHPEKVSHLVLVQTYACGRTYWELRRASGLLNLAEGDWANFTEAMFAMAFDWKAPAFARALAAHMRQAVTQRDYLRFAAADEQIDVTPLLTKVKAPTLICHYPVSGLTDLEASKHIAARIPNSNLALLGSVSQSIELLDAFLGDGPAPEHPRRGDLVEGDATTIRTILFTDIEDHDGLVERLGDARSRDVLRAHEQVTREALRRHGGHEVKAMGDGFLASFGSAARALECATALQSQLAFIGNQLAAPLRVRIGINAGEPISEGGDLFGSAVIAAARIAAKAAGGEVLVSNVVRELTAGKGFLFSDRGEAGLRGLDDPVRLWQLHL